MRPASLHDPDGALDEPVRQAIERAKVTLLLRHAMAGVFLTRCRWIVTLQHPTAAVDGRRLWLNPAFFLELSPADRVFVLLHEALHVALGHHLRGRGKEPKLWNSACDYVVNASILEMPTMTLPVGALFEPRYARASAEQVYADLHRQTKPESPLPTTGESQDQREDSPADPGATGSDPLTSTSPDAPPSSSPGTAHGDVLPYRSEDGSLPTEAQQEQLEQEHAVLLQQLALTCGKGTPALSRDLEVRRTLGADFRQALLRFVSEVAARGDDFALVRRNTRYMASIPDIVLPGAYSERLGRVIAVVDTSGSIGVQEIGSFTGALEEMLQAFPGLELTVIAADNEVHEVHEIPPGSGALPEGLVFSGHGGTDLRPAIVWAQEHANPQLLVYLTDGFGEAPEDPPAFPVLWALPESRWSRPPAPWGVVAYLAA